MLLVAPIVKVTAKALLFRTQLCLARMVVPRILTEVVGMGVRPFSAQPVKVVAQAVKDAVFHRITLAARVRMAVNRIVATVVAGMGPRPLNVRVGKLAAVSETDVALKALLNPR